jgi:hypothetical protein
MAETTCKECGEPCTVIGVDFGIGAYEYWGATGYDSRVELVSNCCEVDFDGEAPEPDYAEPDYDMR